MTIYSAKTVDTTTMGFAIGSMTHYAYLVYTAFEKDPTITAPDAIDITNPVTGVVNIVLYYQDLVDATAGLEHIQANFDHKALPVNTTVTFSVAHLSQLDMPFT